MVPGPTKRGGAALHGWIMACTTKGRPASSRSGRAACRLQTPAALPRHGRGSKRGPIVHQIGEALSRAGTRVGMPNAKSLEV